MILRDPIHGLVAFEGEEDAIVTRLLATREVQRLRRVRQLGLTSFAFPGAEPTRFSHAIGPARGIQLFPPPPLRLYLGGNRPGFWPRARQMVRVRLSTGAFDDPAGPGPRSGFLRD